MTRPSLTHAPDPNATPIAWKPVRQADLFSPAGVQKCGSGAIMVVDLVTNTLSMKPLYCDRWDCPQCSKRKEYRFRAMMHAGRPERLLVLTLRPRPDEATVDTVHYIRKNFRRLLQRLRRNFPRLEYLSVLELTKRRTPHLHILTRGCYVPQRMLSAWWKDLTGSHIVHISKIDKQPGAIAECAKYLIKTAAYVQASCPHTPIVTCSRKWLPPDWTKDSDPQDPHLHRIIWQAPLRQIMEALDDLGAEFSQSSKGHHHFRVQWPKLPTPEQLDTVAAQYSESVQDACCLALWVAFPGCRDNPYLSSLLCTFGMLWQAEALESAELKSSRPTAPELPWPDLPPRPPAHVPQSRLFDVGFATPAGCH